MNDLNGKRVMVVEDDYLLATDICRNLRELGANVLGPAPTPFYAMHLINRRRVDAAVLDVRLHGVSVFEVADSLMENGVPIVFATGYDRENLPHRFHDTPILSKPYDQRQLMEVLHTLAQGPVWAKVPEPAALTEVVRAESPAVRFARTLASTIHPAH
ncbi:response regulator [uncultured Devosia sp.]|uniref:response regulator n=1 Tax=uncultured Devosia sp. TaxID=211434 RepID=UPI0035CB96D2